MSRGVWSGRPLSTLLTVYVMAVSFVASGAKAETQRHWSGDVQVVVDCSDPSIKDQFTSSITRELQTLGDVSIVEKGSSMIMVLASETKTSEGVSTGFAASIIAEQKTSPGIISLLLPTADKNNVEFLKSIFSGAVYVRHASIATGTLNDIPATAKNIVAAVDLTIFQPSRSAWQRAHMSAHPAGERVSPSKPTVHGPSR